MKSNKEVVLEECPHPEWLGVWANAQGTTLKIRWGSNGEKMGWLLEQYGLEIYTRDFEGPYPSYKQMSKENTIIKNNNVKEG